MNLNYEAVQNMLCGLFGGSANSNIIDSTSSEYYDIDESPKPIKNVVDLDGCKQLNRENYFVTASIMAQQYNFNRNMMNYEIRYKK